MKFNVDCFENHSENKNPFLSASWFQWTSTENNSFLGLPHVCCAWRLTVSMSTIDGWSKLICNIVGVPFVENSFLWFSSSQLRSSHLIQTSWTKQTFVHKLVIVKLCFLCLFANFDWQACFSPFFFYRFLGKSIAKAVFVIVKEGMQ